MSFETYTQIYQSDKGFTLRVGKGARSVQFPTTLQEDKQYRLFTVGETEQYYLWKDEPDCPMTYRAITDALNTEHAIRDRYCLDLSCKQFEDYKKRVYKKIHWQPVKLSYLQMTPVPTQWELGIVVSAKNLKFRRDGYLRMRMDIRLKKDGVDHRSVSGEPDERIIIEIPAGTYTGKTLLEAVTIPEDTANVGVFLEGTGYQGQCYVEQPKLGANGHNLLPAFTETTAQKTHMDWTAQYLSRKEWPEFRVRLNGKVIFTGEMFERCHRYSEWELTLPRKLLQKENTLSYELISDYHEPVPYTVYEIGIIEQPAAPLSVIAVSEAAPVGGFARVLVKTQRPNMDVTLCCDSDAIRGNTAFHFREAGLHGIRIFCEKTCERAAFRLAYQGGEASGCIGRIVVKQDDKVITGTGDMIYVHQDETSMEEYLSWYISNHVGDLVTIRPTYRWSGTRTLNQKVWRKFRRLMQELDFKYVLMTDGRELPGISTQPDAKLLAGKGFLGMQRHETDGSLYCAPGTVDTLLEEQWANMLEFAYLDDPDHTASRYSSDNYLYYDGEMHLHADRRVYEDYRQEHEKTVRSLSLSKKAKDNRHTGPSAIFKYLAEVGYQWLGAETMYQTMEPIMGFLRGAVKHAKLPTYGVHHAVQWSTTPHDSPARYRRYRLALYVSYLQGASEINTEEGLWRLEEYYSGFHRFSDACKNHLKAQQDFYRYVSTHTRSGSLYHPAALLHGRDDGITFFYKDRTWGQFRPQTQADDSWDLIRALYPKSLPGEGIYIHNCPEDEAVGYYSGTPYGNVDIIPAEARASVLGAYRALAFLGYNRLEAEDGKKLISYAKRGGRVLLTDAHMTQTSVYADVMRGNLAFGDNLAPFCKGEPEFVEDSVNGISLWVCANIKTPAQVLAVTDSGRPLVCKYTLGKGEVVLFHTKEYPAHAAICQLYEAQLGRIFGEETAAEHVWTEVGEDVEFAVYKQDDGTRHIYLLAVDWYNDPNLMRQAALRLGHERYAVQIPFGTMLKCVCTETAAMWCGSEAGEVLSLTDGEAKVQGTGKICFTLAKGGTLTEFCVDFTQNNVQTILL